jgi:mRNA-degrading endonuclease YafQ of YafQ-DinJ toxin-antitoxin module
MEVAYKTWFLRQFKKLPPLLQDEAFEKIESFKNVENHSMLKVHKLHGYLKGYVSFSINYRYRIIFKWEVQNKSAVFYAIGDHAVYG